MYAARALSIEESGFQLSLDKRFYRYIMRRDTYYHILTELFVNDFILLPTSIGYLRNLFILMSSEPSMLGTFMKNARIWNSYKICLVMLPYKRQWGIWERPVRESAGGLVRLWSGNTMWRRVGVEPSNIFLPNSCGVNNKKIRQ